MARSKASPTPAGIGKPFVFKGDIRSFTTGRTLGQDAGSAIPLKIVVETTLGELKNLNVLGQLQKGGTLLFRIDKLQLDLDGTADTSDDSDQDEPEE